MTSFHIFKSIFNSSFEFYGLSEWLLEIMPDNVDINRCKINRSHHGWIFRRHNARSKFICMNCMKSQIQLHKEKLKINTWTSVYTTILFRARLDKSFNGQNIGRIQMRIFEQGCHTCNIYSIGILDENEIKRTFYWLYIWILETFYNVKFIDNELEDICIQSKGYNRRQLPHDSSRCDGCRAGWCKYLYRCKNKNSLKRHTVMSI
ncbi:unnamed protein product [Rotaria sordida]|uniref:3CxxC-type domain-containing protein n=1 Tax=Rotaria sordida TaxID=392033 RepID=A0A814U1V8_9BILA|nr:unnamed protein product [Rotaria sordida]CAF1417242.1 unnamed protein product [Rotaria sordida]